ALGAAIPTFVGKVILSDWDPTLGPNPYDKPEPEPEESLLERAFNFLDEDKTWRTADLAEHYSVKPASIRMRRYRYKRVIRKFPSDFLSPVVDTDFLSPVVDTVLALRARVKRLLALYWVRNWVRA